MSSECARALERAGFRTRQGFHVRDGDKAREVDVVAFRHIGELTEFNLVECKYAKKPWVVFSAQQSVAVPLCARAVITSKNIAPALAAIDHGDYPGVSILVERPRIGFSVVQALTDKHEDSDHDRTYQALRSLVNKAKRFGESIGLRAIIFPVVVMKGRLFEAYWDEESKRVTVAPCRWKRLHWFGAEAVESFAILDVVTTDSLEQYLIEREPAVQDFLKTVAERDAHVKATVTDNS